MSSPSLQQACSSTSSSAKFSGLQEINAELRITIHKTVNIFFILSVNFGHANGRPNYYSVIYCDVYRVEK